MASVSHANDKPELTCDWVRFPGPPAFRLPSLIRKLHTTILISLQIGTSRTTLAKQRGSSFTKSFREFVREAVAEQKGGVTPLTLKVGWDKQASLSDECFPEGASAKLKSSLEKGERVCVRCPVKI